MVEEQLVLKAGGPVQCDLAVTLLKEDDASLQLLLVVGADGEGDPAGEHRGVPAGLELGLVFAGEQAVLLGL